MRNQRVKILLSTVLAAVMLCGTAAAAEGELFFSEEELLFTDEEAEAASSPEYTSEETELSLREASGKKAENKDINGIYERTAALLGEQASVSPPGLSEENGEWLLLGLARGGGGVSTEASGLYRSRVLEALKETDGALSHEDPTVPARAALALTALGEDASDYEGYSVLEPLADLEFVKSGGTEAVALTILAFDCHDYEIPEASGEAAQTTRMGLISYLLGSRQADGGWADEEDYEAPSGSGLTALALQALAPYYGNNSAVTAATDDALSLLSSMQEPSGGFGDGGSVSCARLVTALGIMKIDAGKDAAFTKEGGSLLDALLRYEREEGGFSGEKDGEYSQAATEQACCALASYLRFRNGNHSFYDMNDVFISGDLEKAAEAEAAIDRIPGKLSLEDRKTVQDAQTLYQLLTEKQRALVDEKKASKLERAVARMKELEEEAAAPAPTPGQEKPNPGKPEGGSPAPTPTPTPAPTRVPTPTPAPQGAKPSGGTKTLSGTPRSAGVKKKAPGKGADDAGETAKPETGRKAGEAAEEIREASEAAGAVEASMKKLGRLTDTAYTEKEINAILKTYKKYRKLSEEERAFVEESRAYAGFREAASALGETWHFDRETGISLKKNEEKSLPWYVKVEAEPLMADEKQMEEIRAVLGKKSELFSLQDIRFVNMLNGKEWTPEEVLKVKLPAEGAGDYESAVVVHISDEGVLQFLDGRQTGAYMEFEAADFSAYGIAGFMGSTEELLAPRQSPLGKEALPWILGGGAAVLLAVLLTVYRIGVSVKTKKKKRE